MEETRETEKRTGSLTNSSKTFRCNSGGDYWANREREREREREEGGWEIKKEKRRGEKMRKRWRRRRE